MPAEDLLCAVSAGASGVGRTDAPRPPGRRCCLPVARLRQVPDAEARERLLTALLALLPQEEIIAMVEKLLEDDTFI